MTTSSLGTRSIVTMLLLGVPACHDSSAPTSLDAAVAFVYSGTLSGRFQASGPASNAANPTRSFAVAFLSSAGELQLCAYQAIGHEGGNFLLLNAGIVADTGRYVVPPGWAPTAISYQPGTLLIDVDGSRSAVEHISPFVGGVVHMAELNRLRVRGSFTVTSAMTELSEGRFDVPMSTVAELPVICQ
jgi:hypothetical protein